MTKLTQQTAALAAAFQALTLIIDIARRGRADPTLVSTCMQGLLKPYQPNVAALYGGVRALRPGMVALRAQLERPKDVELTRYAIALLHLESKLRKQPERLQAITAGLERARRQIEFFGGQPSAGTYAALASLYSEQISDLRPRIMIAGERSHLEQTSNTDLIRALLLAAIRAISLWRDRGGSRLDLLFRRRRMLTAVNELLGHEA